MVTRTRRDRGMLFGGVALAALTAGAASAQQATLVQTDDPYFVDGQAKLQEMLALEPNTNQAKNVILMVGDGMGVGTITAARILAGQLRGEPGEENSLSFERFPHAALIKTYNTDKQVPDSAGTSSAMHSGVKTRSGTIGVNASVPLGDCAASKGNDVTSILELAEQAGRSTGVVSTARITHATPAAAYAHSAHRDWEDDKDLDDEARAGDCHDIARQLIEFPYGDGIEVALGGGRRSFMPAETADPENEGKAGERQDGRDLTQEWLDKYANSGAFVWNEEQFQAIDPANVDHLLGLFEMSHMQYEADRDKDTAGEPSLSEMTAKAIDVLSKNPNGYYLMVEGGRIDHAHHEGNAYRALHDTIAFADAVLTVVDKVDLNDTLVLVTADHSHVFTIAGYADRGSPILGLAMEAGAPLKADDGLPYTTLGYANGPGGMVDGKGRADLSSVDVQDIDFVQQATVPMSDETHSGEDVMLFAAGPWSQLVQGVQEQSYVMDYASKIGEQARSD